MPRIEYLDTVNQRWAQYDSDQSQSMYRDLKAGTNLVIDWKTFACTKYENVWANNPIDQIKSLNDPLVNEYIGIQSNDWITAGVQKSYHVFRRYNRDGLDDKDYFTTDTLEIKFSTSDTKNLLLPIIQTITYFYWPTFRYTPRNFTDADFAQYSECPT